MAHLALPRTDFASRHWRAVRVAAGDPGFVVALVLVTAVVLIADLYPLFQILSQGVLTRRGEFDLGAYQSILTKPVYQTIIFNTLKLGGTTALLGTAIGF